MVAVGVRFANLISRRRDWMPLARLLLRLTEGRNNRFVIHGVTRICIEGYPRSANSVAVRLFRHANPVHIAHHTHAVANVAAALKYNIPVICLIRDPLEAISSNLVRSDHPNVVQELADYQHFYRYIQSHLPHLTLAGFETVVSRFDRVIDEVNQKYGTGFQTAPDSAMETILQDIRSRYDRSAWRDSDRIRKIPVPDSSRETLKQHWKSRVQKSAGYEQALQIYHELEAGAVSVRPDEYTQAVND